MRGAGLTLGPWLRPGMTECRSLQILAYKEDFTSERADRERAQSRIQELEDQVAALQRQASRRQVGVRARELSPVSAEKPRLSDPGRALPDTGCLDGGRRHTALWGSVEV